MAKDILIIDDEKDIRDLISDILKDEGFETRTAPDGQSALEALADRTPHVIILDIWLNDARYDGLELLTLIKKDYPDLPIIMMSGHGTIETAVDSLKKGAYDFIEKPFKADHLIHVIERALDFLRLRAENEELRRHPQHFPLEWIGDSSQSQQIKHLITKIAPTNSRVFLQGESGTGKDVLARLIHLNSKRNKGPFIKLNCANLNSSHLDEVLFGKENLKSDGPALIIPGTLERAHQGTLYLDEVADLPLEIQGKILKALQNQSFKRVSGTREVAVDVRIISSTKVDIKEKINAGKFREDLYYRLNVMPIEISPLRERHEDVKALLVHFLALSVDKAHALHYFNEEALNILQYYSWPGNTRQLRNIIEWILIMSPLNGASSEITPSMLPSELLALPPADKSQTLLQEAFFLPLREAREIFEKEYLKIHLERFNKNISQLATHIGMERTALHRKLKALNLAHRDHSKSLPEGQ